MRPQAATGKQTIQTINNNVPSMKNHSMTTTTTTYQEDRLRRKLQFFFMNPIEKWQARHKFPFKFVIQLIKIIVVTIQLCLFAEQRYSHANYTRDNRIAFSNLFLRGWHEINGVNAYPPAKLASYSKEDFYDAIDYAVLSYSNLSQAIGPYFSNGNDTLRFCVLSYAERDPAVHFNPNTLEKCENLGKNVSHVCLFEICQSENRNRNICSSIINIFN